MRTIRTIIIIESYAHDANKRKRKRENSLETDA